MMDVWELPTSLEVGGEQWKIRTDFRAILDILKYFADPEYEDVQWDICLDILYEDFADMPYSLHNEAAEKAVEFIDMGIKDDGKQKVQLMDWEKDAPILATPISKNIGHDIRLPEPVHWWTFLGAYMEIGESLFSQIINIRIKIASHKKLEKWEQKFYRDNKNLIDLPDVKIDEDEEMAFWENLLK